MKVRFITKRKEDRYAGVTIHGVRFTDPALDDHRLEPVAYELRAGQDSGWRLAVLRHFYDGNLIAVAIERTAERAIGAAAALGRCPTPVCGPFLRQVPRAPAR